MVGIELEIPVDVKDPIHRISSFDFQIWECEVVETPKYGYEQLDLLVALLRPKDGAADSVSDAVGSVAGDAMGTVHGRPLVSQRSAPATVKPHTALGKSLTHGVLCKKSKRAPSCGSRGKSSPHGR